MSLGDVYLDSYPFSGSVSLVDPLEAGVPPVAWRAASTRGLMAASMLSDLDLRELVAESEEDYVACAVRLATDPQQRERLSAKIRSAMAAGPRFFDVQSYGREVSRVLEEIVLAERETEKTPPSKEIIRRAESALASGRLSDVEDMCRHLLEREPATAACWALLAELARRCGDLAYASDLAGQAVELEPESAEFWRVLGEIRRGQMDPAGAMDAFSRALELSPSLANAWLGKAVVHDERREFAQAEQAYSRALSLSKDRADNARIRVSFAGFLKVQKRMTAAIKQMRQAASDTPDSCETLLLLGSLLKESGDLVGAISIFSRVAEKHPSSGRGWFEWGKALLFVGKQRESVEKLRMAVDFMPDDSEALLSLKNAIEAAGEEKTGS
jgi:predicted O-linked N-acetylglucosamine transferase (SPINDLY family)